MDSPGEILSLCRLCLVKDQVNIPIFEEQGDIRQIFLKISSCLPVTITRHDQLPKKICDACSNKLDLLYEFWNSSATAEKTLLSWLGQAGVTDAGEKISAVAQQISKPVETLVKEESETLDESQLINEANVINETNLTNESRDSFEEHSLDEDTKDEAEAPPPKRARRTAAVKAQINITPESDEDDDEDYDAGEAMTKMEDESDESESELKDDPSYSEVPGTSADDQAGPSGVGKDGVEAPKKRCKGRPRKYQSPQYRCDGCSKTFKTPRLARLHHYFHLEESSFKLDQTSTTFTCIFCSAKFSDSKDIKAHMVCHSTSCKKCHQNFQNPFFLGLHMAEHNKAAKVFCPLCDFSGKFAVTLRKHICSLHFGYKSGDVINRTDENESMDEETEPRNTRSLKKSAEIQRRSQNTLRKRAERARSEITCKTCNKTYSTLKDLRNHKKVHKAERMESLFTFNSLRKTYSCDTCLQEFPTEGEITQHVEAHSYTCTICSVKFKKALLVGLHMAEHNDEGYISCPICNYEFKTRCKSRLIRHIKQTHHKERPKTSQCEYCGSSYLSKTMLEDHIRVVHLQKEPYKCIVCGSTFTLQSSMRIHQINKHRVVDESELSSNYCVLCKMSFKKPSSLAKHLEMKRCIPTPRVERQGHFVCDLCGKEFRFYKTFNLHLREHAGDKPYKCSYCPKSFVINSKRLAHEVSHTDLRPFSCETCGQSYKTWKHLRRHLVVHGTNPKVTFNCSFCGTVFSTKDSQRTHMRACDKSLKREPLLK